MEAKLRPGLPIIFVSPKMRSLRKKLCPKGSSFWVVKEVKDDEIWRLKAHIIEKQKLFLGE